MESWMAFFEPPKVSLTTRLSQDLDHFGPSIHATPGQTPPSLPPDLGHFGPNWPNPPHASPLAKAFSNSPPRIVNISRNALYKAEISVYGRAQIVDVLGNFLFAVQDEKSFRAPCNGACLAIPDQRPAVFPRESVPALKYVGALLELQPRRE